MKAESVARWLLILVLGAIPTSLFAARQARTVMPGSSGTTVDLHARMPENGGWSQTDLRVQVGQPLHLRLTSDDVVHGFAIGQSSRPALDVLPGEFSETTLIFDQSGRYTFYCTRWCGPNHWRMRGTIEVLSDGSQTPSNPNSNQIPYYQQLDLDLDATIVAKDLPAARPSATRGARLGVSLPAVYRNPTYYKTHSPAELWQALRSQPLGEQLSGQQVWDLVAWAWQQYLAPGTLSQGQQLYAQNCASCHGQSGGGDGVFADQLSPGGIDPAMIASGHEVVPPARFDQPQILAENSARLQGKILRGGMGTGMPYWGPIFTDDQTWALVNYLWSFSMEVNDGQK